MPLTQKLLCEGYSFGKNILVRRGSGDILKAAAQVGFIMMDMVCKLLQGDFLTQMFIYIGKGFRKEIRHNSQIFRRLAGNNPAVDHDKTLLKKRTDHDVVSPRVLLQLRLKGSGRFGKAAYVIFVETKQIQLGGRGAQKTLGKICFAAAERTKGGFPDIDDNTVILTGMNHDRAVKGIRAGENQIPPFQLFTAAFRIIIYVAAKKQIDFITVMVMKNQRF